MRVGGEEGKGRWECVLELRGGLNGVGKVRFRALWGLEREGRVRLRAS